jgi:hypothetical protein
MARPSTRPGAREKPAGASAAPFYREWQDVRCMFGTGPGLPSRSHAIRELVIQALDAAEAPKTDKKPKG